MANTTWDPAATGSGLTLSGGNLTITTTTGGPTSSHGSVGYLGNSGLLLYFEVTATTVVTAGNTWGVGIGVTTDALTLYVGGSASSAGLYQNGRVYNNTLNSATYFTFTSGATIGVAVDFVHGKLWWTNNGSTWNNAAIGSQNPATNTGGYSAFSINPFTGSFTIVPVFGNAGSSGAVATANFGATAFSYTPPTGFVSWNTGAAPPNYVDFAGNIGSVSLYGKGLYGARLYSSGGPFAPVFAGDFSIVGQQFFAGDLAPAITFNGSVGFDFSFIADLPPQVALSANLTLVTALSGDLAPQVTFSADLSLDLAFQAALTGRIDPVVGFAASSMISGPLWGDAESCPPPLWTETEPCPPSLWTEIGPCDDVEWTESQLCNG